MNLSDLERNLDAADAEPAAVVEACIYAASIVIIAVVLWLAGCCLTQEYSISYEQRTRDGETVRAAWKAEVDRR